MLRSLSWIVTFALVLVPLGVREGRAGDDEPAPPRLVLRVFEVGALTGGHWDYIPERMPGPPEPRSEADEMAPLFGAEAEESTLPLGTVDELIELVKSGVSARAWAEVQGSDIKCLGGDRLVVRARPAMMEGVARFLADLERRVLSTVTVEVRTAHVPTGADPANTAALLEAATSGPSMVLTAFPGQRASGFTGSQRALLAGYFAHVATGTSASVPVVEVANVGLAADARLLLEAGSGAVRVELNAFLADGGPEIRTVPAGGERAIEAGAWQIAHVHADVVLAPGAWRLVKTTGPNADGTHWDFLLRATVNPFQGKVASAAQDAFDAEPAKKEGPLEIRRFDIGALGYPAYDVGAPTVHLWPSQFTEPEPPELPDGMPRFPAEALVEFMKEFFPADTFGDEEATMEARRGLLIVRARPGVLDAVESRLGLLRRLSLWEVTTRVEVVEVPDSLAMRLLRPEAPRIGAPLLDADGSALLAGAVATRDAVSIDEAVVTSLGGARNATVSGRWERYLSGYAVNVAENAVAAWPITSRCLSGFVVDVHPWLTSGGDAVSLSIQATRTNLPTPFRTMETPHGAVELPTMDVLRIRTGLAVPLGRTAIVGAGGAGGRTRLLLVTPTLRRPGD